MHVQYTEKYQAPSVFQGKRMQIAQNSWM